MPPTPRFTSRCRLTLLAAGFLLTSVAVTAGAQEETAPQVFRETAEVNVVNVEVAVTDKQGRPVNGLGRENFELFENGKPVAISNFFAVQGGREAPRVVTPSATAPVVEVPTTQRIRQNHLIIYIDNANIRETNRRRVFKSLREFLRGNWRPDLWAMVISNDRSLTIRQEFTPELETTLAAIDELAKKASAQPRFDAERRQIMRLIEDVNVEAGSGAFGVAGANVGVIEGQARALLPMIRGYSEERLQYVRETLGILNQFVTMAAGMPGRKSVLYVSDGLSMRPGEALYEGLPGASSCSAPSGPTPRPSSRPAATTPRATSASWSPAPIPAASRSTPSTPRPRPPWCAARPRPASRRPATSARGAMPSSPPSRASDRTRW